MVRLEIKNTGEIMLVDDKGENFTIWTISNTGPIFQITDSELIADLKKQLTTVPSVITPIPQSENIPEKVDGLNFILNAVADAIKERGLKIG